MAFDLKDAERYNADQLAAGTLEPEHVAKLTAFWQSVTNAGMRDNALEQKLEVDGKLGVVTKAFISGVQDVEKFAQEILGNALAKVVARQPEDKYGRVVTPLEYELTTTAPIKTDTTTGTDTITDTNTIGSIENCPGTVMRYRVQLRPDGTFDVQPEQ